MMLDVAIIGGGLSGLALARRLRQRGRDYAIFEARSRIGGRVLTARGRSGGGMDLGATWYWPQTQPLLNALVKELEIVDFPQHDVGHALLLREGDKKPEQIEDKTLYEGARRLHGGMGALIDAIAAPLPKASINLDHCLSQLRDHGDHIELSFMVNGQSKDISARYVVLALPPRVLQETVDFQPPLHEATDTALLRCETWMAAKAKVALEFEHPFWREKGLSGAAFVTHEQATLGEIYDACDPSAQQAALGGFLALGPEHREAFAVGLELLVKSQVGAVFGTNLEPRALHHQDWAKEPYTCSAADRIQGATDHPGDSGNPLLRQPLWDRKLYFGGSETAARSAGYLEGALDAARRVDHALASLNSKKTPRAEIDDHDLEDVFGNDACLARFSAWVDAKADDVFEDYRLRVNRGLASHQRESLTQMAVLGAIEDHFQQALQFMAKLPFDSRGVVVERGRVSLTPQIQKPFADFLQKLMDDIVAFNQTSCALSNFPEEHRISKEYKSVILQDIAAAWREFSLAANRLLIEKTKDRQSQEKTG